jgi:hypothetical protein
MALPVFTTISTTKKQKMGKLIIDGTKNWWKYKEKRT